MLVPGFFVNFDDFNEKRRVVSELSAHDPSDRFVPVENL
jgi:hypothetical protein